MKTVKSKKKKKKSSLLPVKKENSSITFEIDQELNIIVHSRINTKVVTSLIDKGYINAADAENEGAIQVAFILMANEVTEQLLEEVSGLSDNAN